MSAVVAADRMPAPGAVLALHDRRDDHRCRVVVLSSGKGAMDVRVLSEDVQVDGTDREWTVYANEVRRGAVAMEVVG